MDISKSVPLVFYTSFHLPCFKNSELQVTSQGLIGLRELYIISTAIGLIVSLFR
jgi:hypothetical protein